MKRYIVLIGIVLTVLVTAFWYGVLPDSAFGQDEDRAGRAEQRENMKEKIQNMTPEEREKFRQEMLENSKKWENMSDEEREKLRDEMHEKFSPNPQDIEYDEQLISIKLIEQQVARLKAAVEAASPENRSPKRELPEKERAKLREKMTAAMRDQQAAIRAVEQELEKLKGPGRPVTEPRQRISELKSIHKLAVEEKATKTAERLQRLIAGFERESQSRVQLPVQGPLEGEPGQRRERPVRPEKTEQQKTP